MDAFYRCPDPAHPNISCFLNELLCSVPVFSVLSCCFVHFLLQKHRSQDFYFSLTAASHRQTGDASSTVHQTFCCFSLITFPKLLSKMEREKNCEHNKPLTTRRLLLLHLLRLLCHLTPISTFNAPKCNLSTQTPSGLFLRGLKSAFQCFY